MKNKFLKNFLSLGIILSFMMITAYADPIPVPGCNVNTGQWIVPSGWVVITDQSCKSVKIDPNRVHASFSSPLEQPSGVTAVFYPPENDNYVVIIYGSSFAPETGPWQQDSLFPPTAHCDASPSQCQVSSIKF